MRLDTHFYVSLARHRLTEMLLSVFKTALLFKEVGGFAIKCILDTS